MEQRTFNVYNFSELSATAKARAKYDTQSVIGYSWADDMLKSLKALAEHFGGRLRDWDIDFFACSHSSATFEMPELESAEIMELLDQLGAFNPVTFQGHGDCKLTGYCGDEDAIDGFRIAFKSGESDLICLMQAAFRCWLKAAQADAADQYSDATFSANCDANEYRFYDNGELA